MAEFAKNRRSLAALIATVVAVALIAGITFVRGVGNEVQRVSEAVIDSGASSSTTNGPQVTTTTTTTFATSSSTSSTNPSMSSFSTDPLGEPKIDPKAITAINESGEAQVVVVLDVVPSGTSDERAAQVKAALDQVLARLPEGSYDDVSQGLTVATVPFTVNGDGLNALSNLDEVTAVKASRQFSPLAISNDSMSTLPVEPTSTNATTTEGANIAWEEGKKGSGAVVAVLDTGVDVSHPYFSANPKTIWEGCFAQSFGTYVAPCTAMTPNADPDPGSAAPCPMSISSCSHGTHVAGIAVGGAGTTAVSGVAPSANLVAVNVFSYSTSLGKASSTDAAIINALNWLYNRQDLFVGLSAVNLSVGDGQLYTGYCDFDPLKPSIDQLAAVGIATVIAAGNEGRPNGVSSPACISSALTVGAVDDTTGQSTQFSNDGPQVDVMAAGESICSSVPAGATSGATCSGPTSGLFRTLNGTSMAAPAVAGAVAVMSGDGVPASDWKSRLQRVALGSNCVQASAYTIPRLRLDVALGLSGQRAAPCAPSAPSASLVGTNSAMVAWLTPISMGTGTLSSFTATASTGQTCSVGSASTSCTVTNLPAPATLTFSVIATSTTGVSPASIASNAVSTVAPPSGMMIPLNPARLVDTRSSQAGGTTVDGQFRGKGAVGQGVSYGVRISGRGGVPAIGVGAVALNVTVQGPTAGSFLTVFPSGASRPNASNLNYAPDQTIANMAISQVGSDGFVVIYNNSGATNVIVDVVGWFPQGNGYTSIVPTRFVDTRVGPESRTFDGWYQGSTGPIFPGQTWSYVVAGRGSIPVSGVAAVAVNVTVVGPTDGSFLTVFPAGAERPTASNLNFVDGQVIPNMAIVSVGQGGGISFYNHRGLTNVVVDVVGWFAAGPKYAPLVPERLLDSRPGFPTIDGLYSGSGELVGGAVFELPVAGRIGIPASGVSAVALNVTVTGPTLPGYLTVFPAGSQRPTASNLNFTVGQTIPNMVICGVGANGRIALFSPFGFTNVIVDVVGWFP
jgi:subtilisin family serine protease